MLQNFTNISSQGRRPTTEQFGVEVRRLIANAGLVASRLVSRCLDDSVAQIPWSSKVTYSGKTVGSGAWNERRRQVLGKSVDDSEEEGKDRVAYAKQTSDCYEMMATVGWSRL